MTSNLKFRLGGKVRAALLSGIALGALATPAFADIDTLPQWDGSSFISSFGLPNTATYGQTFTASAFNAKLSSFTFELRTGGANQPQYQAFVYAWDGVNNHITGPALFTSAVQTAPAANSPNFTAVTINTGAPVVLTPGQQYVVLFTTSSVVQPNNPSNYQWGSISNNTGVPGGQFVFMNNGTTFGNLSTNTWSSFSQDLAVDFVLAPLPLVGQLSPGAPINVVNVATGFDHSVSLGNNPPAPFNDIYALSGAALNQALEQVDGEVGADLADSGRSLLNPFLSGMITRFGNPAGSLGGSRSASLDGAASPSPAAAMDFAGGQAWLTLAGSESHSGGDPLIVGSHSFRAHQIGIQGGLDYQVGDNGVIGLSLGDGSTDFSLNGGMGTARSNAFELGAYTSWHFSDAAYISGAFAYAWQDFDTRRIVTVSGTDDLQAHFSSNNYGGRVEGGYRLASDELGITPYVAVQYQQIDLPAYSEVAVSGSSAFALTYASRNPSTFRTELGVDLDRDFTGSNDVVIHLYDRMAWVHDSSSRDAALAAFGSMPGSAFTVFGAQPMRDAGLVSLGMQVSGGSRLSLGGQFDALIGDNTTAVGGKVTVSYAL